MRIWRNYDIPVMDFPCWFCQTDGKISRRKVISLPPLKDTFVKIVSKNNSAKKSLIRSIIARR